MEILVNAGQQNFLWMEQRAPIQVSGYADGVLSESTRVHSSHAACKLHVCLLWWMGVPRALDYTNCRPTAAPEHDNTYSVDPTVPQNMHGLASSRSDIIVVRPPYSRRFHPSKHAVTSWRQFLHPALFPLAILARPSKLKLDGNGHHVSDFDGDTFFLVEGNIEATFSNFTFDGFHVTGMEVGYFSAPKDVVQCRNILHGTWVHMYVRFRSEEVVDWASLSLS